MNASPELIQFASETQTFAMQIMENVAYIQKELPGLELTEQLRSRIEELCRELIGSKHDLITELSELDDDLRAGVALESVSVRVKRIQGWICSDAASIHECVETVNEAAQCGDASFIVSMLVMESATNILHASPTWLELEDEEDANSEDAGEDDDCFGFNLEDSHPIRKLTSTVRRLATRSELSPETLEKLRVFLFAMERLPLVTPGVRMSLALRLDQGGESAWIEIRIEDGEFTLGRGSWIDGDANTETVFEVSQGCRDGDAFVAMGFADSFSECAEDVCREIVIEDSSDEAFDGWNLAVDQGKWNDLPCSFL